MAEREENQMKLQRERTFFILMIRGYQKALSPLLGASCRFYPSCSNYAIDAIEKKGVCRGGMLSLKRLLRCHPFHSGGYDPVET